MTQILGTGEGKTSSAAKEPVVERKPAQVFFESMALAASMSGYYAGPTATTLGNSLSLGAGTAAGVGEGVAGARVLAAPNPLTVALLAIFYSPSLNEGETETLQNISESDPWPDDGGRFYPRKLNGHSGGLCPGI